VDRHAVRVLLCFELAVSAKTKSFTEHHSPTILERVELAHHTPVCSSRSVATTRSSQIECAEN
jgi:hypothetical protein